MEKVELKPKKKNCVIIQFAKIIITEYLLKSKDSVGYDEQYYCESQSVKIHLFE